MARRLFISALALALLLLALAAAAGGGEPTVARLLAANTQAAGVVYHGNVRSRKFHRPGCRYYNCKNCTARFTSRQAALDAGYVPCKVCRP